MSATMGCGHCGPASADEMRPWAQCTCAVRVSRRVAVERAISRAKNSRGTWESYRSRGVSR